MAAPPPQPVDIPGATVRRWMVRGFVAGLVLGIVAVLLMLMTK